MVILNGFPIFGLGKLEFAMITLSNNPHQNPATSSVRISFVKSVIAYVQWQSPDFPVPRATKPNQ
jgi:hypothetical protein